MIQEQIIIDEETGRLDKVISQKLPDMSRSQLQQLLKKELILVNDQVAKANYKVKKGDTVTVLMEEVTELKIEAQNIPLTIVYEDDDVLVVNKVSGMVVHPSKNHTQDTLVNALLYHVNELSTGSDTIRPGIVHRIDKDTSGLLVIAKNNYAHQKLTEQLVAHTMQREYIALVNGVIEHDTGTIDAPLARDKHDRLKWSVQEGGKYALTHFKVLKRFANHTLVSLRLETGRTHQIRVHMQYIQHALVGDPIYSTVADDKSDGQYLHAQTLGFKHPRTDDMLVFTSDLPEKMTTWLAENKELD